MKEYDDFYNWVFNKKGKNYGELNKKEKKEVVDIYEIDEVKNDARIRAVVRHHRRYLDMEMEKHGE